MKLFFQWQHGGFVAVLEKWTHGQAGFSLDSCVTLNMTFGLLSSSEEVICFSHFRAREGEKLIGCDLAWMNSQCRAELRFFNPPLLVPNPAPPEESGEDSGGVWCFPCPTQASPELWLVTLSLTRAPVQWIGKTHVTTWFSKPRAALS